MWAPLAWEWSPHELGAPLWPAAMGQSCCEALHLEARGISHGRGPKYQKKLRFKRESCGEISKRAILQTFMSFC